MKTFVAALLCASFAALGCGSSSTTDDSSSSGPPVITNFAATPSTISVGATTTLMVTFTIHNPGADALQLGTTFTAPDGTFVEPTPTSSKVASGVTDGQVTTAMSVTPTMAGTYTLGIQVSNERTGLLSTPNGSEFSIVAK